MKKYLIMILIIIAISIMFFSIFSACSNFLNKSKFTNTFAIQNVKTSKNLRPYNASKNDSTRIILYNHKKWKCMTWEFIQFDDSIYLLKNLYTQKTFEPSSLQQEMTLWQQPLIESHIQYWEFIKQSDETYLIRLKNTDLYITITSDKKNSDVILMPKQNSDTQLWRLLPQNPLF